MLMLYSRFHELAYRAINKLNKSKRKEGWAKTPHQGQAIFDYKDGRQLFEPHLLGPQTLLPSCSNAQTIRDVLAIFEKLEPDPFLKFLKAFYQKGLENFGERWVYADIATALYGVCKNLKVESYLEIGVRRGRSMCMVASQSPQCRIVGFDMWIPNYAGEANPGKDFVRNELSKVGYRGKVDFIDGNSRETVPSYFQKNPDAYFDLVTVDGDHSIGGAIIDIKNVIPRIKVGGVLVFDDICSPEHPYLKKVWDNQVANTGQFAAYSFTEVGLGIGFAVKRY